MSAQNHHTTRAKLTGLPMPSWTVVLSLLLLAACGDPPQVISANDSDGAVVDDAGELVDGDTETNDGAVLAMDAGLVLPMDAGQDVPVNPADAGAERDSGSTITDGGPNMDAGTSQDSGMGQDSGGDSGMDSGMTLPGVGESCAFGGSSGTCIDVDQTECEGTVRVGLCPGPAPVRCCLPSNGSCTPRVGSSHSDQTLTVGGTEYRYELHIPENFVSGAALVIDLHGYTESPDRQDRRSEMRAKSDEEGFILVQPDGPGNSWNGGACCGSGASRDRDDVAFIRALIDVVAEYVCIDRRRVYATGMSNGGFLAHRLGCEAADVIAAIAPVAGVMGIPQNSCQPSRAVPVMHFHGTADLIVPYNGNGLLRYPSVSTTMSVWRDRNSCTGSATTTYDDGNTECETWASCRSGSEVTLCTIRGGGHSWPDGGRSINATNAMWTFFQRHSL